MNKQLSSIITAMLFGLGTLTYTGCGNEEANKQVEMEHEHQHEYGDDDVHQHASVYQCPMQCEGEKTYSEPGKCPKCNMELEEVNEEHSHEHGLGGHDDDGHQH